MYIKKSKPHSQPQTWKLSIKSSVVFYEDYWFQVSNIFTSCIKDQWFLKKVNLATKCKHENPSHFLKLSTYLPNLHKKLMLFMQQTDSSKLFCAYLLINRRNKARVSPEIYSSAIKMQCERLALGRTNTSISQLKEHLLIK